MATKNGIIKKTSLSEFTRIQNNGKIAIRLNEGDELIGVELTSGEDEVLLAASNGKCIRFSEKSVRPMGRVTTGVKSMKLDKDAYVVDMAIVKDDVQFITITEKGYGKRTSPENYRLQSRGGKGISSGRFNEKTGKLVALKVIKEDEDLMLIADNGIIIRMLASDISLVGRNTFGVKVMRLKDDAKIVSVATTEHIEEDKESALGATQLSENQSVLTEEEIKFAQDEQPINE